MKGNRVLITGGAGFIGQHLCRALLNYGRNVRVVDSFEPQVHGEITELTDDLRGMVELVRGDVRDSRLLADALGGVDRIVHLAAETGTGQSMYEIERYFSVNVQGTAALIQSLQDMPAKHPLRSIVVASSRAVYGEGAYRCADHGLVFPDSRKRVDLEEGRFDPRCPICGASVSAVPTEETAPFKPMSVYGLTKQVQEQAILMYAKTADITGVALRYQNVYGPGQSLRNPYTGILAVFSNLAREGKPIDVYEDGEESRDFVFIDDVVESTVRAILLDAPLNVAVNVGSGVATTVRTVAEQINQYFGRKSTIRVSGNYRVGDIRHNLASRRLLKEVLAVDDTVDFSTGIRKFLAWAEREDAGEGGAYERAAAELAAKGLMRSSGR